MVSIYRSAKAAFRDVLFLPGSTNVVLCSNEPLPRDPEIPAARLRERHISAKLISAAYLRYLYGNDRFTQVSAILTNGTAPANTDNRPICYQYTVMLWLSKFFPSLAGLDLSRTSRRALRPAVPEWSVFAAAVCLFLLYRRREWLRLPLLMGTTAFLGMVLETLLLLYYQVKNGVLFQDLGILLMSFMAGLTAGALALHRLKGIEGERQQRMPKSLGIGLVLSFVPLAGWLAYRGHTDTGMRLPETAILLGVSGFLVAAVFAYASLSDRRHARDLIAPLYSADLIGGCLASLVATLILVPMLGLEATSAWMIPAAILAVLLA
jgi:hypothetical protein